MRNGFACVVAAAVAASFLAAFPAASVEAQVEPVVVNSSLVLRVRTPAAGWQTIERRILLDQRMVHILSYEDTFNPDVRIGSVRGKPTIYVGDTKLVTIYPQDAAANNTTMEGLARVWADRAVATIRRTAPKHGKRIPDAEPPDENVPPMVPAAAAAPPPAPEPGGPGPDPAVGEET